MLSIKHAINRHLIEPPFKRNININHDSAFSTSNKMFQAVCKNLRDNGNDLTKHKDIMSDRDIEILLDEKSFNINCPKQLQEKVFF